MKKLLITFFDFSKEMLLKLEYMRSKNWTGWDNSKGDFPEKEIIERIERKVRQIKEGERQEVDLANYCMFLWHQRNELNPKEQQK